jgi:tRNA modification GTPase
LSQPLTHLRERLLETLAQLEAGLDFVDEDIEFISAAQLDSELAAALTQVEELALRMSSRTDIGQTTKVVLRGLPNAGKSSLFNALVARYGAGPATSLALVSDQPGTTRDYLRGLLILGNLPCELVDTAGLEMDDAPDGPQRDAQIVARQQITGADVTIDCLDTTDSERARLALAKQRTDENAGLVVTALTKCDLPCHVDRRELSRLQRVVETSAKTGAGLENLAAAIRAAASDAGIRESSIVANTAQRCRDSLDAAAAALKEGRRLINAGAAEELLAAEIRSALLALGHVSGAVYTDDILDRIFSRFCIGK